jgi:hypothetical protein
MAQSFEQQLADADSAALGFEERFGMLIESQWLWRENHAIKSGLRKATLKIRPRFRLKNARNWFAAGVEDRPIPSEEPCTLLKICMQFGLTKSRTPSVCEDYGKLNPRPLHLLWLRSFVYSTIALTLPLRIAAAKAAWSFSFWSA